MRLMLNERVLFMEFDIFISYRRQGAEAIAHMLYRDLTAAGFSTFYDMETLGSGNFRENIMRAIESCNDFIIVLSKDALSERIYNPDDVMFKEIAYAFEKNKRITGIVLTGFDGFPSYLPDPIAQLPNINCLRGRMEYYDAMFEKLTSGMFLVSSSKLKERFVDRSNKQDTLSWFKELPLDHKQNYMRLLLEINNEFQVSEPAQRVYRYLDTTYRNMGIRDTPPYDGDLVPDFSAYLSFFETLYLMIITETMDLSLIDEMFRFRFFAMCNNPEIQKIDLLPYGFMYPFIVNLYDIWLEMIRKRLYEEKQNVYIGDAVYMYDYDFHRRYRAYCFAHDKYQSVQIKFINKKFDKIELVLRRLNIDDLDNIMKLQEDVVGNIPNNDIDNIYEPMTVEETIYGLKNDIFVGFFHEEKLVTVLLVVPTPVPEQDLYRDMYPDSDDNKSILLDAVLVDESVHGFGIHRFAISLAEYYAVRYGQKRVISTVSPKNHFSQRNFVKCGYQVEATLPKYHSVRDYFVLNLDEE